MDVYYGNKNPTIMHYFSATRLVITATDRGTPRLDGSATLTVIITDLNDNSPMIPLPREIRVPEGKSFTEDLIIPHIITTGRMLMVAQ